MSTTEDQSQESLELATFLESIPPGSPHSISDLFASHPGQTGDVWYVNHPDIQLHCSSETCGGMRIFTCSDSSGYIRVGTRDVFFTYGCRNCRKGSKTYALRVFRKTDNDEHGLAAKFGEMPGFGPPLPSRLISLVGPDRELFLKGRRAESQGLGIGSYSYYRRVVENQKDRILDAILNAAGRLGSKEDFLQSIEAAKRETQFSKAVETVKDAIPDRLKVKGYNPLKLLHGPLSKGLHARSDEECLELAQAIRIVLTELVVNIAEVMKDEREINAAVQKLLSIEQENT